MVPVASYVLSKTGTLNLNKYAVDTANPRKK